MTPYVLGICAADGSTHEHTTIYGEKRYSCDLEMAEEKTKYIDLRWNDPLYIKTDAKNKEEKKTIEKLSEEKIDKKKDKKQEKELEKEQEKEIKEQKNNESEKQTEEEILE